MSENAKIVFPSTHVVFEGLKNQKQILMKMRELNLLAYSSSKVNENNNKFW